MLNAMQDWPLLVWRLLDHAALNAPRREIVSLTTEGGLHRTDWLAVNQRARRLAQALVSLGIGQGDRVATLACNTYRHVECLYGISGMGAVAHTINPRLFQDQIAYIAGHATDRVLFFDLAYLPIVETLARQVPTIEKFVIMTDRAHLPESTLDLLCYEELLAAQDGDFAWAALDENSPAGLCYTSGTTGNPKGVLYSHRSNVLHSFAACQNDVLGIASRTVVLPIVPLFHANAWGIPYATAMAGAKLVLAGPHTDAETLHRLILQEDVTLAAAVPTVWLGMLQHLESTSLGLGKLERVTVGGSAAPPAMIARFEQHYNVAFAHLWGMTEMSPIGTTAMPSAEALTLAADEQLALKSKQGRTPFGVEMRITGDDGHPLPRDGTSFGHLRVRGPWVIANYFGGTRGENLDADGWFDTGDIASIDPLGYMRITDRAKDVIKSGGEWISSIELENAAIGCPGVAEAAVIGVPHPKWDERPLLIVVRLPDAAITREEILVYLSGKVAKWWLPDDIVFVTELPHTATGKLQKTALREQFRGHIFNRALTG